MVYFVNHYSVTSEYLGVSFSFLQQVIMLIFHSFLKPSSYCSRAILILIPFSKYSPPHSFLSSSFASQVQGLIILQSLWTLIPVLFTVFSMISLQHIFFIQCINEKVPSITPNMRAFCYVFTFSLTFASDSIMQKPFSYETVQVMQPTTHSSELLL